MQEQQLILAILAVAAAGVVRGFSGFGAGMILVPTLSLLYSPLVAVVSVVFMELIAAVQLLPWAVQRAHWRSVLPMLAMALMAIPVGAWILVNADPALMRVLIAVIVLGGALALSLGWRSPRLAASGGAPLAAGVLSGVMTGSVGLGGVPVVLFYLSGVHTAAAVRASTVVFLFATAVVSLASYLYHGIVSADVVERCAVLAPVFVLSIWLGGRMFGKVSESAFRVVVLTLLSGMGVLTLVR